MCKKCEYKGISMKLTPIILEEAVENTELPKSWQDLLAAGFNHQDIIDRLYTHLYWTNRKYAGQSDFVAAAGNAKAFTSALAKGFLEPFDAAAFMPQPGDPYFELKTQFLNAIIELSLEFGNRISSVLWDSLAHLGTRNEPEESRSILKEADSLPHHYGIVDTHLHALGKVYSLNMHIQSVVFRHTGRILNHNCDCDCSLVNLIPAQGNITFVLPKSSHYEATQSLFTHLCAESELILNRRLPFEYSITKEAQLLLGIEVKE